MQHFNNKIERPKISPKLTLCLYALVCICLVSTPEYEVSRGYEEESQEPEPEENVDFIIDHVDWQDAQAIKPPQSPIRS